MQGGIDELICGLFQPFIVVFNLSMPSILTKSRPNIKLSGNAGVECGWGGESCPEGFFAKDWCNRQKDQISGIRFLYIGLTYTSENSKIIIYIAKIRFRSHLITFCQKTPLQTEPFPRAEFGRTFTKLLTAGSNQTYFKFDFWPRSPIRSKN